MKLENVSIKRFRSIENAELASCGDFNVLIGKNNSGKSCALSAIHAFFHCIKNREVLTLNPSMSREIDFFNRKTQIPIEITLLFYLTNDEISDLAKDIVSEAPQMKNAVIGISESQYLAVNMTIMPPPSSFSYIKQLSLEKAQKKEIDDFSHINILSIDYRSALELHENFLRSRELSDISEDLSLLDLDKYKRYYSPKTIAESLPLEYLSRRLDYGIVRLLEEEVGKQASLEELKSAIPDLSSSYERESLSILNRNLINKIGTFTGDEHLFQLMQKIS
jgi:predicted ATP-dependent endonuclease of OLD family